MSTKMCKMCKSEKEEKLFAINRKLREKIYYRKICKKCWTNKQYKKIHKNKLGRRGNITENKPDVLNKIIELKADGYKWCIIADMIGVSRSHLYLLHSKGLLIK